jgi:hypothetical protein
MTDCLAALTALERDGAGFWRGLPPACAAQALAPALRDLDPSPAMADLGLRKAFHRTGRLAASGAPVQVWTTTDETEVLLLAFEPAAFLATGAAALERLGEPELRLGNARGGARLAGSEWVYPGRGLAVFVDPDTDEAWRTTLFRACTPADYEEEFRVRLLERRLPPMPGD